jgi:hypothetical protein
MDDNDVLIRFAPREETVRWEVDEDGWLELRLTEMEADRLHLHLGEELGFVRRLVLTEQTG